MATKFPTVRRRSKDRTAINVDPSTLSTLRGLLLRDPELRLVGYSDFIDWAVDVYHERRRGSLKGGLDPSGGNIPPERVLVASAARGDF